jgi:hypothetical protein
MYYPLTSSISNGLLALYGSDERIINNNNNNNNVFRLQKRVTGIITRSRPTDSCRELFKKLKILPF